MPALITAHINSPDLSPDTVFGVIVNGKIRSIVRPFRYDEKQVYLSCLVPDSSFQQGINDVDFVILQNGGKEFLHHPSCPWKRTGKTLLNISNQHFVLRCSS